MRVCIVSDTMTTMAGTEHSVVMTALALADRGHQVAVLAYRADGEVHPIWRQHLRDGGIVLHETPAVTSNNRAALRSSVEFLSAWRADVLHAIPMESLDGHFVSIARQAGRGAIIGTVTSDPAPNNFWYHDLDPSHLEQYDVIICAADVLADRFRHFRLDNGRVTVVPHLLRDPEPPLETGHWALDDACWARRRSLGAITRLREEKGPDFLIATLAMMVEIDPAITLTIYGELVEFERTRNVATAFGVDEQIIWHGPFDGLTQTDSIVHRHCIFLLSSLFESMPIALMEVIARGRLPVATNVGAVAELFRKTGSGRLVRSGDSRAMADATLELLNNDDARRKAALAASAFREAYSTSEIVAHLERIYTGSLAQCR